MTATSRIPMALALLVAGLLCAPGASFGQDEDDEFDFLELDGDDLPERGDVRLPDDEAAEFESFGDPDMGDEDPDWDMGDPDLPPDLEDPVEPGLEDPVEPGLEDPVEPGLEDPVEPGLEGLPEEAGLGLPGDDDPLEDFDRVESRPAPAAPEPPPRPRREESGLGIDTDGKVPLQDNYPVTVVAKDLDAIVVELPVLLSRNRSDFDGKDYWVIADIEVDGRKVAETRHLVTTAMVADLGPSFVWVKSFAPVASTQGTVVVKVRRESADGGEEEPLFEASGSYRL